MSMHDLKKDIRVKTAYQSIQKDKEEDNNNCDIERNKIKEIIRRNSIEAKQENQSQQSGSSTPIMQFSPKKDSD